MILTQFFPTVNEVGEMYDKLLRGCTQMGKDGLSKALVLLGELKELGTHPPPLTAALLIECFCKEEPPHIDAATFLLDVPNLNEQSFITVMSVLVR